MSSRAITLTVGPAPHWRAKSTVARINLVTILALLPTALFGAIGHAFGPKAAALDGAFGPLNGLIKAMTVEMGVDSGVLWLFGILGTVALAMGAAVLIEYVTQMVLRQPYRAGDGHGALMGLLLALMMPPTVPWWVLLVGVAVAIIIGKQIYGGIGGYPMHPAVVGWLVLMLSWPTHIYPVGAASIAAPTVTAALATLAGGLVLWWAGIIRLQIPLGFLFGVAVFALLFQSRLNGGVLDQLLTGHVLLGAFFLATDSTTSPANGRAMWVYGIATGMLVMLVRAFGIWPDAVPFAVLLMCALSPLVDKLRPRLRPLEASR